MRKALSSIFLAGQFDTVSPEEEFRLLNERYIQHGVIPADSLTEKVTVGSSGSQTGFGFKKGKRVSLKASGTSLDHERSISHRGGSDKDPRILRRESFHEKRVTIDTDAVGYPRSEGSSLSPLPARRSCEPLDVTNLRKLRDSENEPGPSGIGQREEELSSGTTSDIVDEIFATRAVKTFDAQNDDVIPRSDSEDSSKEPTSAESCNVDSFTIDNPFSDFSLQKINRDGGLLRQRTIETAIKTPPSYHDPEQPGTSKGAYAMEIYRRKVSRSESIEQPKRKSREHSFLRSAVSRVKKVSSFLDKAVTAKSSQRMAKTATTKNDAKERKARRGIDREFGTDFLHAIVQRLGGNGVSFASVVLHNRQDDFDEDNMVFHCYDRNLQFFVTQLMEIVVEPIFDNFSEIYPPTSPFGFIRGSFDTMPVMAKDVMCAAETISVFKTAWPKTIDLFNVFSSVQKNMISVDSAADTIAASVPPVPDAMALFECVQSHELVDKITQQGINAVTSQGLIRKSLFLSLSPIPDTIMKKRIFECSYFSGFENYWLFTVGFFATPTVVFLEDFLNFHEQRDYQKCALLERFFFTLIGSAMRNLRFTCI